jgi:hypothetical protein
VGGSSWIILQICGPSCNLRLFRSSARLRFQDRAESCNITLSSSAFKEPVVKNDPSLSGMCLTVLPSYTCNLIQ